METIEKTTRFNFPPRTFEIKLSDAETADIVALLKGKLASVPSEAWATALSYCNFQFANPAKGKPTALARLQFVAVAAPLPGSAATAPQAAPSTPAAPSPVAPAPAPAKA